MSPARWPLVLLAAGLLTGCAGYRLGPSGGAVAGARSMQVASIRNQTPEPRLIEAVNNALRKRLQQDGTYRLDTKGHSDLVLTGLITRFARSPISYQAGDVLTASDYSLALTATITVRERDTGKVIFQREVNGRTTIRAGADLPSAERQAVPLLAEDLARNATSLLVDGTW